MCVCVCIQNVNTIKCNVLVQSTEDHQKIKKIFPKFVHRFCASKHFQFSYESSSVFFHFRPSFRENRTYSYSFLSGVNLLASFRSHTHCKNNKAKNNLEKSILPLFWIKYRRWILLFSFVCFHCFIVVCVWVHLYSAANMFGRPLTTKRSNLAAISISHSHSLAVYHSLFKHHSLYQCTFNLKVFCETRFVNFNTMLTNCCITSDSHRQHIANTLETEAKSLAVVIISSSLLIKIMIKGANGAYVFWFNQNGFTWKLSIIHVFTRETTLSLFHIFIVKPESKAKDKKRE